ncbi:hypothetical protein ASPTUDRAFT_291595 [Aspergillus tubingensis CBS 134.48]|uniref:Uncharacterized protein n=1 Tax=Aspergillus tubingensis (strain CBS 134.48) TaxID=767770 RepID=A0A1L9NP92_ASPTC|nr:hypothetical protein ASPTUDRAFT_291595 [Aspergillus tubingensis CBS 134.48]
MYKLGLTSHGSDSLMLSLSLECNSGLSQLMAATPYALRLMQGPPILVFPLGFLLVLILVLFLLLIIFSFGHFLTEILQTLLWNSMSHLHSHWVRASGLTLSSFLFASRSPNTISKSSSSDCAALRASSFSLASASAFSSCFRASSSAWVALRAASSAFFTSLSAFSARFSEAVHLEDSSSRVDCSSFVAFSLAVSSSDCKALDADLSSATSVSCCFLAASISDLSVLMVSWKLVTSVACFPLPASSSA